MSIFQLIYLLAYRPFEEAQDNYIEIFNEGCVLILFSFVLIYCEADYLDPLIGS